MAVTTVLFYVLAAVILASSIKAARSTNLVHSAFFTILSFLGVAGIFLLLYADFLAMAQVLVYVGAISVLLVFGIMLTRRGNINESNLFNKYRFTAAAVGAALFLTISISAVSSKWAVIDPTPAESTVLQIANLLLSDFALPFEAAGVLLLAAMVGSIIIGKEVSKKK